MKAKAGRPRKDDKMVLYVFTVLDSEKTSALEKTSKNIIDGSLRKVVKKHSKNEKKKN